jgi:hypothetical protein
MAVEFLHHHLLIWWRDPAEKIDRLQNKKSGASAEALEMGLIL